MECVSVFNKWDQIYYCDIESANITEPGIKLSIQGKHLDGYTNNDVTRIRIQCPKVEYMSVGLGELFPNLKRINLWNCGLRRITKNDLFGMQNLEEICIKYNPIKYIPGDLFEDTRNLKEITFIGSEIKFIEEGLIDGLEKLECLDLGWNFKIYSRSLKTVLAEIQAKLKCYLPNDEERKKYHEEGKRLEEIVKKRLISAIEKLENKSKAFESFLESGRLNDMKIIIEDETFKVHKVVLGARSSVLADIFEKNKDVIELNLKEIKKESFKIILNFIYKDELPDADTNYLDLYSACGQLNIFELIQICEEKIKVENKNVAKVVTAANKFGSQKLKDEAFEVVKKMFPDHNISKELTENPEDLKKILEILEKYSSKRLKVSMDLTDM